MGFELKTLFTKRCTKKYFLIVLSCLHDQHNRVIRLPFLTTLISSVVCAQFVDDISITTFIEILKKISKENAPCVLYDNY